MARFLTGRGITLRHTFLDGEAVLSPTSVSVTATPLSGGTPTTAPAVADGNEWVATLPALTMGEYEVTWDGGAVAVDHSTFDVSRTLLFTVPEARDSDRELRDATEFPASEITHYREVIEHEFEKITHRSFIQRRRTVPLETTGADARWIGLHDPTALVAISGPDGPLAVSDYHLDADGVLSGLSALPVGTPLEVTVDYGFRQTPPDVKRAALIRLRYLLAAENSGVPDRATMFQAANGGMFYLATAGRSGFETGIPEVDHVLSQYTYSALYSVMGAHG